MADWKLIDDKALLNIYVIEELETADDISEGIDVMSTLSQNYRHLHVELNNKLGNNYVEQFPNYNEHLTTLTNYIKSALGRLVGVGRAKQVISGPLVIIGIGDQKSVSKDGVYSVCLSLQNGRNAVLSGPMYA